MKNEYRRNESLRNEKRLEKNRGVFMVVKITNDFFRESQRVPRNTAKNRVKDP